MVQPWMMLILAVLSLLLSPSVAFVVTNCCRSGFRMHMTGKALQMSANTLKPNDVVAVVGAFGGVGRLVTRRLLEEGKYKVRALCRNVEAVPVDDLTAGLDSERASKLELVQGDIKDRASLDSALSDAHAIIALAGTTAFPTGKWRNGNTPDSVFNAGITNVLEAALADSSSGGGGRALKKFLFVSSVGVDRRDSLPFSILNLFGVLNAMKQAEENIESTADKNGFDFTIIRPGRLIGEPFTNPDVATLMKTTAPKEMLSVALQLGDMAIGDAQRGSVAEVFVQALEQEAASNKIFTVVNSEGQMPSQKKWDELFARLHVKSAVSDEE